MLRRLAFLGSLAAACGGGGSWQRCGSTAECPAGTFCDLPVSGEQGVCQAPAAAALTAPAPGAYVGANASISATLTLASAGIQAPAGVALRLGGSPVATLALQGAPAGQVATYAGTWNPGAAQNGPGSLDVLASLDVAGATVPVSSPPVAVTVDTLPPSIQAASASCAGGCRRDSVLDVTADATDASVLQVTVSLDLEPGRPVAVTRAGSTWSAAVALQDWPFPWFQRTAQVTVRATDLALNEATATLPVDVTRLRWAYTSGATAVTSPAVMSDGTIVFGVSATSGQLRALRPDMTEAFPPVTVGSQAVTASPSIGPTAIWVASNDGKIYAVAHDGSAVLNGGGSGCSTGGAIQGTPAVVVGGTEVAFAASTAGRVYAADVGTLCVGSPLTDAFSAPACLDGSGNVLAVTANAIAIATLRKYTFDGGAFTQAWSVPVGVSVTAPIAIDASGDAWSGSQDAKLNSTTAGGATTTVATLPGSIRDSAVIAPGGDVVVGDQSKVLHRYTSSGVKVWPTEPVLGGPVLAPLALTGGDAAFLVPTEGGTVHAVDAAGGIVWEGALSAGQALRAGNVHTPAGSSLSTAYFGCADGNLYAVIVDGQLDTTAPWPKAHHDVRNTANAGSPLP